MKSPFTENEMKVAREERYMTFRNETFQIVFHCYICEESGEQFEDEHFSDLNYNQVINTNLSIKYNSHKINSLSDVSL